MIVGVRGGGGSDSRERLPQLQWSSEGGLGRRRAKGGAVRCALCAWGVGGGGCDGPWGLWERE